MRSSLASERGVTLVELLVAMMISMIAFSAVLGVIEVFARDAGASQQQSEAQDQARAALDELSAGIRNAIAGPSATPAVIERATPFDLIFQRVDNAQVAGGANRLNALRVRYCLDSSDPSNGKLYMALQRWSTAVAPAVPAGTACPGTATWTDRRVVATHIVNRDGTTADRPIWTYGYGTATPGTGSSVCTAAGSVAGIATINSSLSIDVKPGHRPGAHSLTGGVSLRNANRPPCVDFTLTQVGSHVLANATTSQDPDGDPLTYRWTVNGAEVAGANLAELDRPGLAPGSTATFTLTVSDPAGLSATTTKTIGVQ